MKTFMAQCPTVLPLCHVISSFVLEWMDLYIITWEGILAWWGESAWENAVEMGRRGKVTSEMKCFKSIYFCCVVLPGTEQWDWAGPGC